GSTRQRPRPARGVGSQLQQGNIVRGVPVLHSGLEATVRIDERKIQGRVPVGMLGDVGGPARDFRDDMRAGEYLPTLDEKSHAGDGIQVLVPDADDRCLRIHEVTCCILRFHGDDCSSYRLRQHPWEGWANGVSTWVVSEAARLEWLGPSPSRHRWYGSDP